MTTGTNDTSQILSKVESLEMSLAALKRSLDIIERRMENQSSGLHARTYRAIEALISTYRYLDSSSVLPPLADPFGGWAITAEMARLIAELFHRYQPSSVVELGSGASTVLMGQLLAETGGSKLVSLEHDPGWYAQTLEEIHSANLFDIVDLRYAPLSSQTVEENDYEWYSTHAVKDLQDIDFVLVDGPPGHLGPNARYPAGPLLAPKCSKSCLFVVDDSTRSDEQEIVDLWVEEIGMTRLEEHFWHKKGAIVLHLGSREVALET